MKTLISLTLALGLLGCQSEQASTVTLASACEGASVAIDTATSYWVSGGELTPEIIKAVDTLVIYGDNFCTGDPPVDPQAAVQKLSDATAQALLLLTQEP